LLGSLSLFFLALPCFQHFIKFVCAGLGFRRCCGRARLGNGVVCPSCHRRDCFVRGA
jgi:hypothetical protein